MVLEKLKAHAIECYPQECCGIIIHDSYISCVNKHSDPVNNFLFSENISKKLAKEKADYIIIHSHTQETFTEDPRIPSLEDMKGQENTDVKWGIIHCDGENITDILYFGKPLLTKLEGRIYISNVLDCFTICRDFYYQKMSITLGSNPRPINWQDWNPHYIENTYTEMGFKEIEEGEYKIGDVLLFSLGFPTTNHLGIYTGNNTFIHHLQGRKSSTDKLSKWDRQLRKVLRYDKQ